MVVVAPPPAIKPNGSEIPALAHLDEYRDFY